MKKCSIISAAIICLYVFTNCGNSPKSQGEKLGQEYCDCQKDYAGALDIECQKNFNT